MLILIQVYCKVYIISKSYLFRLQTSKKWREREKRTTDIKSSDNSVGFWPCFWRYKTTRVTSLMYKRKKNFIIKKYCFYTST